MLYILAETRAVCSALSLFPFRKVIFLLASRKDRWKMLDYVINLLMVLYRLKLSPYRTVQHEKEHPWLKTCEGSQREPEGFRAEPDDAQIPFSFKSNKIASPTTNSKLILVVFGRRLVFCPFTLQDPALFQYFILQLVPQLFTRHGSSLINFFTSSKALPNLQ